MEASVVVVVSESAELKQEEAQNKSNNNSGEAVVVAAAAAVAVVDDSVDHGETDATATSTADSSSYEKKKKGTGKKRSNRIQVSNTKKPFVFYLHLAKRYIKQYNDIELSALGMAIPTVVTIAEILKRDGLANSKEIKLSTVDYKEDHKGHFIQKAKIQIVMGKAEKPDKTTTATAAAAAAPNSAADDTDDMKA